jgi:hypothetical protein
MPGLFRISTLREATIARIDWRTANPLASTASFLRRLPSGVVVAVSAGLATFIVLLLRNAYVFSAKIYEDSDFAANSILVSQAQHLRLLVGNYSRIHFNHPGPALLYVEAAGNALFHDLLGLVPTAYNGELLAVFALNALLVALVVRIVWEYRRTAAVAAVALATVLAWSGGHVPLGSAWFPHLYYLPFLLLAVAAASVAAGRTRDLPALVLASGLLFHGHVAFAMFVGVTVVVALGCWAWSVRRGFRGELTANWRALAVAGVLLFVFLLPIALELVLHWPGQWQQYLDYVNGRSKTPNPLPDALRYAGGFWSPVPVWGVALALAGVACTALAATDPDRARRRFLLRLLGAVVLESLLFLVYAVRGVDNLHQTYIGIFYGAVPLALLLATGLAAARLVDLAGRFRRSAAIAVLGAGCAGALVAAVAGPAFANRYRGDPELPAMVAALEDAPARQGRPVRIVRFSHDAWPQVAGFVVVAQREGLRACIDGSEWTFMFTSDYSCASREDASGWQVVVRLPGQPQATPRSRIPPPRPVWTGSGVQVIPVGAHQRW